MLLKITNEIRSNSGSNNHSNFEVVIMLNNFKIAATSISGYENM